MTNEMDFEIYNNNDEYGSNMKLFSSNNTNIDDLVNKIIKENTFTELPPSPLRLNIKEQKEAEKEVIVKVNFKGRNLLEKLKRKKENTTNDNNSANNLENINQPIKFSLSKENSPNNNNMIESKTKSISPQDDENKNIKKEYSYENRNKMRKVEKDVGDSKENNHKHDFTRENSLNEKTSPPEKSSKTTSEKKKNSNEKIPIQRSVSNDNNSEKPKASTTQSKSKETPSSSSKTKQETKREKESSPESRDKKNRNTSSKKEKIPTENSNIKMEKAPSDPNKPKRRNSTLSSATNNTTNNVNGNRRSSSSTKTVESLKEKEERGGGSPKKRKRTPSPPKGDVNVKQSPRKSATKESGVAHNLLKKAIKVKHIADKESDKKKQRMQYLTGGLYFFQSYFKFEEVCSIYESNGKTSDFDKMRKTTIDGFTSVATYFLQNGKLVNDELEILVKSPPLDENKKKELSNFVSTFYQCASFCFSKIYQLKSKPNLKKFQSVSKSIKSYSEKNQVMSDNTSNKLCDILGEINPLIEMRDCWEKAMKWHIKGSACIENVLDPCYDQVDTFINVQMTKLKK